MRAGALGGRSALANYYKPARVRQLAYKPMSTKGPYERMRTKLKNARKTKRLGYTPKSKWDGMTRPQKAIVKGLLGGAGTALAGGLLGGLISKFTKKKSGQSGGQVGGRRSRTKTKTKTKRRSKSGGRSRRVQRGGAYTLSNAFHDMFSKEGKKRWSDSWKRARLFAG